MHPYLEILSAILLWLLFPVYWIAYFALQIVLYIVQSLYGTLLFLLQPVIFTLVFIGHVAYIPIDFISRLETLYIYLGVGIFVGIIAGVLLHLISRILTHMLGLGRPTSKSSRTNRQNYSAKPPEAKRESSSDTPMDSPFEPQAFRRFPMPALTVQAPSPQRAKRRTLLEQTLDEDVYESDL